MITSADDIKMLMSNEYCDRLRNRPLRPDLQNTDFEMRRSKIFQIKMKTALETKSSKFQMSELDFVLKNMKHNLSADHDGYINEIFKPQSIGDNLKKSR